jgi:3-isopropylmalate dehydrogenase
MHTPKLLLLPGDGIGPEVMDSAVTVLEKLDLAVDIDDDLVGGASIDSCGRPLAPSALVKAIQADAVLLAAVGGPKWDGVRYDIRPEAGLLALRKELELFANIRPAKVFDALVSASTLKPEVIQGLDIVILRELVGGVYFGAPRGIEEIGEGVRRGINTQVYTTPEIERIARVGFEMAQTRGKKLCSVDKANVMESGKLWRETVSALAGDYPDVALSHMYADNCAMQLIRNPRQFDVIVTDNLFGDMLSDEAAMMTGSLGMLPSASFGPIAEDGKRRALYEPVHGSAPDIAGKGVANPLATLLCLAMCLRHSLEAPEEADRLEYAIQAVLSQGMRTPDIMSEGCIRVGTEEMTKAVCAAL